MDDRLMVEILLGHLYLIANPEQFDTAEEIREFVGYVLDEVRQQREEG